MRPCASSSDATKSVFADIGRNVKNVPVNVVAFHVDSGMDMYTGWELNGIRVKVSGIEVSPGPEKFTANCPHCSTTLEKDTTLNAETACVPTVSNITSVLILYKRNLSLTAGSIACMVDPVRRVLEDAVGGG